jgi:hypothetical protein
MMMMMKVVGNMTQGECVGCPPSFSPPLSSAVRLLDWDCVVIIIILVIIIIIIIIIIVIVIIIIVDDDTSVVSSIWSLSQCPHFLTTARTTLSMQITSFNSTG